MADTTVSLEFILEADKADLTLGELKKGFTALEEELENTKRGTKRFDELSTAMAQTNREVKNLELGFEALDNEQVASEIGSVAGAIGDVTASFILMGGESETMVEIGENIEKAMAVSMGLKGAIEGISSAQKLWTNLLKTHTVVQKALTVATKLFKFALAATGIGLIIVAVGALAGKLDTLKNVFISIGETIYSWVKPQIDLVIKGLQLLGIMESDTEKAIREAGEGMVKSYKDRQEAIEKEQLAHKKATDDKVMDMDFEIARRKASGEDTTKIEKKKLDYLKKAAAQELILQFEKVKALKSEMKARIVLGDVTQEQVDEFNEAAKEQIKTLRDSSIAYKKLSNEVIVFDATQETKRRKAAAEKKQHIVDDVEFEKIATKGVVEMKTDAIDMSIKAAHIEMDLLKTLEQLEQEQFEAKRERAREEDEARQKKLDDVQAGLDVLNNGADAFIKDEEKREKVKKKLAIAQLAVDTARSISSGIAAAAGILFPGNLIAFLPTIAAILGNMASARALLGSSGGGGGASLSSAASGSAGASAGVPIDAVSNTSTILGDQQVYVTETDITSTQNKVSAIEAKATF